MFIGAERFDDKEKLKLLMTSFEFPEVIFLGSKGSGKTAFATFFCKNLAEALDINLYANYEIDSPCYIPLTSIEDLKNAECGICLIDELQLFADSRNFKAQGNMTLGKMLAEARKNGVWTYGITQHLRNIDVRLRQQFTLLFRMKKHYASSFEEEIYSVDIFRNDVGYETWDEIEENCYLKTNQYSFFDMVDMFKNYNTLSHVHILDK